MSLHLRINVSVDLENVWPAVVVIVDRSAAPADVAIVDPDAGRKRHIAEGSVPVIAIEIASVVRKVRLENIKPAVAVVIGNRYPHASLLMTVFAVSTTGHHRDVSERPVVIVVIQDAWLRVHSDIDIGPAIVVKIVRNGCNGISRTRFQNSCLLGHVSKSSVTIVVIKNVGIAGQTAGTAHHRNSFPLANRRIGGGSFRRIELDVIADQEVEMAVAVVVKKRAPGAPANLLIVNSGLVGNVGERAVAVVVEQDVVPPEAAEQIIPAVVVVVAHADSSLPAGARQSGFLRDISEGSVAIIFVEMGCRCLALRPVFAESRSVGQVDIEPTVVVIVEKRQPTSLGLHDVLLTIDAAPDIGRSQPGLTSDVEEHNRRNGWRIRNRCRPQHKAALPFPDGRCESVDESAAQHDEGRAKEMSPREVHSYLPGTFGNFRGTIPEPSLIARI